MFEISFCHKCKHPWSPQIVQKACSGITQWRKGIQWYAHSCTFSLLLSLCPSFDKFIKLLGTITKYIANLILGASLPSQVTVLCYCFLISKSQPCTGVNSSFFHVACPRCMSTLHVYAACPCCMSKLYVHTACPFCTSLLHVHTVWPYCMLHVHDVCLCCMPISTLHDHAVCLCWMPLLHFQCCMSILHALDNVACSRCMSYPCCMSLKWKQKIGCKMKQNRIGVTWNHLN